MQERDKPFELIREKRKLKKQLKEYIKREKQIKKLMTFFSEKLGTDDPCELFHNLKKFLQILYIEKSF